MWKLIKIKNEDTIAKLTTSVFFFVNCERISHFLLIVDFEQKNVSWILTEKTNTFEDKIGHVILF